MKILFLSDDFPPTSFGGAGMSVFELALGMHKAGHDVYVVTTCRDVKEEGAFVYEGVAGWRILSNYPGKWRSYKSLYNSSVVKQVEDCLAQIRPDVVHANNIHFHISYHSLKVAKRYAKKVVFTARDTMAVTYGKLATERYLAALDSRTTWRDHLRQAGKRWNPLRNLLVRHYLGYADEIIAVSEALREALQSNGIANVKTIHTGIDIGAWRASTLDVQQFRSRHALQGKKVVLFGGRVSPAKGAEQALRACARVLNQVPNAVLLVVGVIDEYVRVLQKEAQRLGVEQHVVWTGWIKREEMPIAYAAADVVLVPSLYLDPFPRTVLEAMASGKPVIGTRYGGAPEAIQDDITGYIVDPFDVVSMAGCMRDLLTDSRKAQDLGDAGRLHVQHKYSLTNYIADYMAVYETLRV